MASAWSEGSASWANQPATTGSPVTTTSGNGWREAGTEALDVYSDLKTVYLGSLMGHTLPTFRSPVAGLPMAHWLR